MRKFILALAAFLIPAMANAQALTGGPTTATPLMTISGAGAASFSPLVLNGTIFTGGSGTTTFPYMLFQTAGTTATTGWSTNGTVFGINYPNGFTGNCFDIHSNGTATAQFTITCSGSINPGGSIFLTTASSYSWAGRARIQSPADGIVLLINNGQTDFTRLDLGGTTSSFPALGRSSAAFVLAGGDGTIPTYASCTGFTSNSSGVLACTTSDERTKTVQSSVVGALPKLMRLKPVRFQWHDNTALGFSRPDDRSHLGLLAQNVCNTLPDACARRRIKVGGSWRDINNYDDRSVIAVLVAAVQEQQREIEAMKARK